MVAVPVGLLFLEMIVDLVCFSFMGELKEIMKPAFVGHITHAKIDCSAEWNKGAL